MHRKQQGFTLIELMMAMAITGILAAIAIPAYYDHAMRAKVTEGLNLATAAKFAVAEAYQSLGIVPNQAATGYITPTTELVANIAIGNDGVVTITYTAEVLGIVINLNPTWSGQDEAVVWSCSVSDSANYRHVPAICRNL